MLRKFTLPLVLFGSVVLTPVASMADVCGLLERLSREDATIGTSIGLSPLDASTLQSMGIPVVVGVFGGHFVRTDDVMNYLSTTSCNEDLMEVVVRRATHHGGFDGDSSSPTAPAGPTEPDNGDNDEPDYEPPIEAE